MADSQTNDTISFLQFTISYLESRIALIDQKASLMLAVVGGLFAAIAFITGGLDSGTPRDFEGWGALVALFGAYLIAMPTLFFLLQTIRRGRFFVGRRPRPPRFEEFPYLMWPRQDVESLENHHARLSMLDGEVIFSNYVETHRTTLSIIRAKEGNYARAIVGVKLLAIWTAAAIFVVAAVKVLGL